MADKDLPIKSPSLKYSKCGVYTSGRFSSLLRYQEIINLLRQTVPEKSLWWSSKCFGVFFFWDFFTFSVRHFWDLYFFHPVEWTEDDFLFLALYHLTVPAAWGGYRSTAGHWHLPQDFVFSPLPYLYVVSQKRKEKAPTATCIQN